MRRSFFALLIAVLMAAALHAEATLWTDPVVQGRPGETTGWGFTITNDSGYLVVTATDFVPNDAAHAGRGAYYDFFLAYNFILVGPAAPDNAVTQAFDAGAYLGLGSYTINGAAPFGLIPGQMVVTYDLYSDDPTTAPEYTVTPGLVLTANTAVNVVPEPAAFWLAGAALAAAGWRLRRRTSVPSR